MKAYDVRRLVNIHQAKIDLHRLTKNASIHATWKDAPRRFVIDDKKSSFRPLYERLVVVLADMILTPLHDNITDGDRLNIQYHVKTDDASYTWNDVSNCVAYGILCTENEHMMHFRTNNESTSREMCPGYLFTFYISPNEHLEISEPPLKSIVFSLKKVER
jgi:hypothetical protein